MSKQFESRRSRKYPAAEAAMRHFMVIERLPEKERPRQPGTNFPAHMNEFYGDDDAPAYSNKIDHKPKPARPSPREIDAALAWINAECCTCAWMWQPGIDRRNWRMFVAYAKGVAVQNIADHHSISRGYASDLLDSIFYQIQVEHDVASQRTHYSEKGRARS